jgi:hypothetical protein
MYFERPLRPESLLPPDFTSKLTSAFDGVSCLRAVTYQCRQSPLSIPPAMDIANMSAMEAEIDDEETSPKTTKRKESKSEREYVRLTRSQSGCH